MQVQHHPLYSYWERFKQHFIAELDRTDETLLHAAWTSSTQRTEFYRDRVLPGVAAAFGLELKPELFRRDFAMRATSSEGHGVPLICIESENVALRSHEEMQKLCAMCAPLRVLITVITWDETPGVWRHGYKTELINKWQAIIRAHCEIWPQPGLIGVIVGEWRNDNTLRFYSLAFGAQGNVCDPDVIIFDRHMSQPGPSEESVLNASTS